MIFALNSTVNCQWDEWVIGKCSKTCGTGKRTNTRTKLVVEKNGGICTGAPTNTETCNTKKCPGTIILYNVLGVFVLILLLYKRNNNFRVQF